MTKPSVTGVAAKALGSSLTHTEFNTVNEAVNSVIGDYASISEGVDADTLEGSTKAEVQTHAPASHGNDAHSEAYVPYTDFEDGLDYFEVERQTNKGTASGYAPLNEDSKVPTVNLPVEYGETKLWNKTKNDIPLGWHECDGTNGTEDLSASNPSTDTVYIMYIGGEYSNMTARTINVINNLGETSSYELTDLFEGTITAIEDGTPFYLGIIGITSGTVQPILTCIRTSDGYTLMNIQLKSLTDGDDVFPILVQYVDCTWIITNDN